MAIEVITGVNAHGVETIETYDDAESIRVDDGGHLLVQRPAGTTSSKTLAIFAPGKWLWARYVDQATKPGA